MDLTPVGCMAGENHVLPLQRSDGGLKVSNMRAFKCWNPRRQGGAK